MKKTISEKVLVAMSGGVDSSTTAALLKEQGYDVTGVTMRLWGGKDEFNRCCSLEQIDDAKGVCTNLKIPHYVLDLRKDFKEKIINDFVNNYTRGLTPNPCVRCNEIMKFDILLKWAHKLGLKFIATGHYARIKSEIPLGFAQGKQNPKSKTNSKFKLLKGKDEKKDQSYFLYMVNQKTLPYILFPLGDYEKKEIRKLANHFGLKVYNKRESQEICFVGGRNYGAFLKRNFPKLFQPGDILDVNGRKVGKHSGIAFYTIGQRKGIGAWGTPRYVLKILPKKNALIIGEKKDVYRKKLRAKNINFVRREPKRKMKVTAKIRSTFKEAEGYLSPISNKEVEFEFITPQESITPGQSVVFYEGEEVLGGGIIVE